jgi:hypothetical protein
MNFVSYFGEMNRLHKQIFVVKDDMLSEIMDICFKFIYRNVSRATEPPRLPQIATANFDRSHHDIDINTRLLNTWDIQIQLLFS